MATDAERAFKRERDAVEAWKTGGRRVPGANVDALDIDAGIEFARVQGYVTDGNDLAVVDYALRRHARGEEDGAAQSWMSHFGSHSFTGWRMVLAAAMAGAQVVPAPLPVRRTRKWVTLEVQVEWTDKEPSRADVAAHVMKGELSNENRPGFDILKVGEADV